MPNICEKHQKEDCAECLAEVVAAAAANPIVPTGTETCVYRRPGEEPCGRTAITVGVADARCDKHIGGDMRTLPELPFAIDSKPDEREAVAEKVRTILGYAGVLIADDIDALGCTGLYAKARANRDGLAEAHALALADAQFVKSNIGGAGKGLPCFVPPNLYCLVHDTVGAWSQGQPKDPQVLEFITRELTTKEKEHAGLIKKAQRTGRNEAGGVLMTGPEYDEEHPERPAVEMIEQTPEPARAPAPASGALYSCSFCGKTREQVKRVIVGPQVNICNECVVQCNDVLDEDNKGGAAPSRREREEPLGQFSCPEHDDPRWGCMRCLAEMLAGGADLAPTFIIMPAKIGDAGAVVLAIKPDDIDKQLEAWTTTPYADGTQVMDVNLFVKIAGWRRKLARE